MGTIGTGQRPCTEIHFGLLVVHREISVGYDSVVELESAIFEMDVFRTECCLLPRDRYATHLMHASTQEGHVHLCGTSDFYSLEGSVWF